MRPEIEPCPTPDRAAALAILYRRSPQAMRAGLVAEALADAERGEIDLSGLWVARRKGRMVGALLTHALVGKAVAVWAPEVLSVWGRAALAASLVRTALEHHRERGFRVAQALVDTASPRRGAADLTRGGMPRVTDLTYLSRPTSPPLALPDGVPQFSWRGFDHESEADFREVLSATYVGSLDMPELEGIRSLDDVLGGHRAGGRFDPTRWQVGRLPGEPAAGALVLLSAHVDRDAWEVAYLGLSPSARGRGLGRVVLAHALELARPHTGHIELAVDTRNVPAARLYAASGFRPFDRRAVHVSVLTRAGAD